MDHEAVIKDILYGMKVVDILEKYKINRIKYYEIKKKYIKSNKVVKKMRTINKDTFIEDYYVTSKAMMIRKYGISSTEYDDIVFNLKLSKKKDKIFLGTADEIEEAKKFNSKKEGGKDKFKQIDEALGLEEIPDND